MITSINEIPNDVKAAFLWAFILFFSEAMGSWEERLDWVRVNGHDGLMIRNACMHLG